MDSLGKLYAIKPPSFNGFENSIYLVLWHSQWIRTRSHVSQYKRCSLKEKIQINLAFWYIEIFNLKRLEAKRLKKQQLIFCRNMIKYSCKNFRRERGRISRTRAFLRKILGIFGKFVYKYALKMKNFKKFSGSKMLSKRPFDSLGKPVKIFP